MFIALHNFKSSVLIYIQLIFLQNEIKIIFRE
jgi:hypothetical protein